MIGDLQLTRPLAFFDIESTGVVPQRDRIVEISVMKVMPDGSSRTTTRRLNPGMPIPPGATAIHGISDADVADCPQFADIADKLLAYLDGCDLAGYNIQGFDVPLLENEFKRVGLDFNTANRKIVDAYNLFCKLYPRTLTAAYKFFCGKDLEGAHGAAADTAATFEVLMGQLAKHAELPRNVDELAAYSDMTDPDAVDRNRRFKWNGDEVMVNFGKYAGRSLRDIAENEPGFLRWIIKSDFPDDVRAIAEKALVGIFPERKQQ
ncbi:MAG: 3'-5' exonuclease [Lentisphaerae bacterium]|nr:3'-5' exonuclease [Lentisphaerota bacterium]